jgi:hypothetical protein
MHSHHILREKYAVVEILSRNFYFSVRMGFHVGDCRSEFVSILYVLVSDLYKNFASCSPSNFYMAFAPSVMFCSALLHKPF